MVAFLIKRPVAVTMTFLGILVLGWVAAAYLPVSLVPDVDIPRISVQVNAPGYGAREMESRVMERLRMYLMQVNGLRDLKTQSRDGHGIISLEFEYGTSIDLAYIEVNEQVDKATAALPRDLPRPAVVKASASDIPVFYLDIHYKNNGSGTHGNVDAESFLQLSAFADEIIRRRLEQIPQVAMADMSGRAFPEIIIRPHTNILQALGLTPDAVENTIRSANVTLGNITIRDKQYQYNVRVGTPLISAADIGSLWLSHQEQLWQLKDLCHIETRKRDDEGMVYSGSQRAITMAIIKQADARMQELKTELHTMVDHLRNDYPHLQFTVYRDQTLLLDYTLANLGQTLVVGALLAFVVMFLFLRDARAPWLIVISVPAAVVVSLLFFYLLGISLNIVSLSGLILCVGMMIDNSIIVIDNITRYRGEGLSLSDACVRGTTEVFTPLLSSVLTTCSVFIPLIFMGGLAGALFFDQAMAVTIGLLVSLLIAMTLIPVYYFQIYKNASPNTSRGWLRIVNPLNYQKLYDKGFRFTMRRQPLVWTLFVLLLAGVPVLFHFIPKEQLPRVQRTAMLIWIDWNENIHVDENHQRVARLLDHVEEHVHYSAIYAGRQQFLMENLHQSHRRQSLVYLQCQSPWHLARVEEWADSFMQVSFPNAIFRFEDGGNLFDQVFGSRQAPLEVRLRSLQPRGGEVVPLLSHAVQQMGEAVPDFYPEPLPLQEVIVITPDLQLMALHNVEMTALQRVLSRFFNENQIIALMDNRISIPVKLGSGQQNILPMLYEQRVANTDGVDIPLSLLLTRSRTHELQTITAGLEGEYYPVEMDVPATDLVAITGTLREMLRQEGIFEASFTGSIFARKALMKELLLIGMVALLLLFFILAVQFESLRLPMIVLLEVPIAMAGALAMLMLFGASLNIMSMIGLVVMAGIIINDSILKIDTINRLRASGMPLMRALHKAGHYRLKPILMTSITTIFALLPFLFIKGLGGELQKPLALAVMGGLALGTVVSLYFVPLCYFYLYSTKPPRQTTLSRPTSNNTDP
ncbi:MAG: efflux RND transporter permease subunit, partial [Bacteroidota bacterium]